MSNAGFEVVGMADHLRGEATALQLATLSSATRRGLSEVLREAKLEALVEVKNPIDVTPSASDRVVLELARLALSDDSVDALVLGIVPMSPALATLEHAATEAETIAWAGSLANTLPALFRETSKPLVMVVDAGELYDPFVHALEASGLPVFRRADEAVRALREWTSSAP